MARSNTLKAGGYNRPKGVSLSSATNTVTGRSYSSPTSDQLVDPVTDWRVRIGLPPLSKFAYKQDVPSGLSNMLRSSLFADPTLGGVVFPYTPQVTITHNARYNEQALVHSNYKNYFYEGSDISAITVTGVFTCQEAGEAEYLMAAIQFLRACTKMEFGSDNPKAGTPPTLVRLYGYGEHYLPSVNCVVTSVSHTMPDDCDYIKYVNGVDSYGWMPTASTLQVVLQPVVSRKRQTQRMSLDDYTNGGFLGGIGTRTNIPEGGTL